MEKISESIRAYSYLVLTSQAAARHGILGDTAPALAAQRIFYDNLEDVINKVVSLEDDIGRYQSTLKYARSTSDYSVGKGLYMLPSDMLLKPLNQVIEGYNDKIIVNTSGFELGKQSVKKTKHAVTVNIVVTKPKTKRSPGRRRSARSGRARGAARPHTLDDHQDEVTSIILALGGLTFCVLWWIK